MNTNKELNIQLYIQKQEHFTRSNIKSEFSRYNHIKYGQVDTVIENTHIIKKNFYNGKGVLSDDLLRNTIYHFVVSAGIIARLCIDAGMPHDDSYTLSDIYIRRADKCTKPKEVIELLCEMQIDYATRMKDIHKDSAISMHIRDSIDYIYSHLHEPLTMEQLAHRAKLNTSYFSKLFVKEVGITAKAYIIKAKIETARNMLIYSEHPIADIALSLGFSSQSAFTTTFKHLTGMTPNKYRSYKSYREIPSASNSSDSTE